MKSTVISAAFAALAMVMAVGCNEDAATNPGRDGRNGKNGEMLSENCLDRFEGITSCALGNATLVDGGNGINVEGMSDANNDGVSSTFRNAISWSQEVNADFPDDGGLNLNALDGGQSVSSLGVQRQNADEGGFALTPRFTGTPGGSAFDINVYNDGEPTGGSDNEPAGMTVIITDIFGNVYIFTFVNFFWFEAPLMHNSFARTNGGGGGDYGACGWRMKTPGQQFTVTLPNGERVTGDEIEFVERVQQGAYPYHHFQGINVTGNANSYQINSETTVAEP